MPIETALAEIEVPRAEPGSPAAQAVLAYLARLAPNSRRAILGRLRRIAPMLAGPTQAVAWHALEAECVADLRDQLLAGGVAPSTI